MHAAFTLIELIVVISIIAILAAIVYTAVARVLVSTGRARCVSNMRSIGTGFSLFLNENNNRYPGNGPGSEVQNNGNRGSLRWHYRIGVYMDLPARLITFETGPNNEDKITVRDFSDNLETFHCPSTPAASYERIPGNNYSMGAYGVNTNIVPGKGDAYNLWGAHVSSIENPANTVLLGDRYCGEGTRAEEDESSIRGVTLNLWGPYPARITGLSPNHNAGQNPADGSGTVNVLFCDGHVGQVELESLKPWPGKLTF